VTYRIQRATSGGAVAFSLSGELDAAHTTELRALLAGEPAAPVRFDLAEVTLVTHDGVAFLSRSEAAGVVLVNCPDYVRRWIAEHRARHGRR
jgi:hypothetical protein